MKKPSRDSQPDPAAVERFISGAAIAQAEAPAARQVATAGTKSKPPAGGFIRSTFDLPEDLHERLRMASAKTRIPMRLMVEEGLAHVLKKHGF